MNYLKIFTISIFLIVSIQSTFAQTQFPRGAYMSFDEILQKQPSKQYNLYIEKRTTGKIYQYGGNEYKLISENDSLSTYILKNKIWAYSDGENLYFNCKKVKGKKWYAKVVSDGKCFVLESCAKNPTKEYLSLVESHIFLTIIMGGIAGVATAAILPDDFTTEEYVVFGALSGAVTGAIIGVLGKNQTGCINTPFQPCIIKKATRELCKINELSAEKLLASNPELLKSFQDEMKSAKMSQQYQRSELINNVIIKYIKIINEE